ncbi:hypothetical protein ACFLT7_03655 [candidate division KSB1 bacterium]
MNSRERVLTALNHQEPDRVPIQADFTPEAAEKLSRHLRLEDAATEAYGGGVSDLPLALGHDLLVAWHGIGNSYYAKKEECYTCEWGIKWRWSISPVDATRRWLSGPCGTRKICRHTPVPTRGNPGATSRSNT